MKDKNPHTTQVVKEIQRIKCLIIEKSSHIHKIPIMKVTSNIGMTLIKAKAKKISISKIILPNTTIKILIISSLPRLIIENSAINSCLRNITNKIIGKYLTNRSITLDFIHLILVLVS